MKLVVQSVARGSHDPFAAVWGGGLPAMALVVFPTVRGIRVTNQPVAIASFDR